ncbi:MAG: amidohydrolase [Candidatus Colwellbacteria bacterium]|nr:amidohydrolase [Candidatus Colwellbacteria bacterium]
MKKIILASVSLIIVIIVGALLSVFTPGPIKEGIRDKWVEAALASKDCKLKEEIELYPNSYQGDLIDTHIHIPSIPDGPFGGSDNERPSMGANVGMVDYICMMENENTKMVFAFFPVMEPIIEESVLIVKKTMEKYPERFVPFIMPPERDDKPDGFPTVAAPDLEEMLAVYPKLFRGYGEIGLYERGDHGGPKGAPELSPDSERLNKIYPIVRENNLLVYFHLGQGQKEGFEKILSDNPDINFIFHGDQLIPYEEEGRQNLRHIDDILSRHPNAYYGVDELYGDVWILRPDVSKENFLAHFSDYESLLQKDLGTWKNFIERHPNQVLWGTDRGVNVPWSLDSEVGLALTRYTRAFIGRLSLEVREKYAYKNAEKLLSNWKDKVLK